MNTDSNCTLWLCITNLQKYFSWWQFRRLRDYFIFINRSAREKLIMSGNNYSSKKRLCDWDENGDFGGFSQNERGDSGHRIFVGWRWRTWSWLIESHQGDNVNVIVRLQPAASTPLASHLESICSRSHPISRPHPKTPSQVPIPSHPIPSSSSSSSGCLSLHLRLHLHFSLSAAPSNPSSMTISFI